MSMNQNLFQIDITEISDPKIEGFFEDAMNRAGKFFGINWNQNPPKVALVKNRKTIDLLQRRQTEDWVVGFANQMGIVLLHPDSYGVECKQIYSDDYFSKLIAHEVTHLFYEVLSKGRRYPTWLTEGVSGYVSGQYVDRPVVKEFTKFLEPDARESYYSEAPYAVKALVDRFGQQKLLDLIRTVATAPSNDAFVGAFKDIYNLPLEYETFNKLAQG